MKVVINILICTALAITTSFLFPDFNPGKDSISSLYTVSGIMFSIGMSLCVTSNTSGVKNLRIKKGIRKEMLTVRNHFIQYFAFSSLLYVFLFSVIEKQGEICLLEILPLRYSHLLMFVIAFSIIFFIWNFLSIQKLNIQIEDAINDENE